MKLMLGKAADDSHIMAGMAKKDSYHHGQLREALVAAALDILERDGLETLSLRRVAAQVGVSHAAPAHHFPTLKHMLTALAIVGFTTFDASMHQSRKSAPQEPIAQLRAGQRGYLAFAVQHPALFRLMFTATILDWDDARLNEVATAARQQLCDICAPAADHLGLTEHQARLDLEDLVWSQVHGQACLMIDQKINVEASEPLAIRSDGGLDLAYLLFR